MTVKDAILSYPGLADFPEGYLTVILASRSLNVAAELETVEIKTVSLAIADALAAFVNTPNFTENKLSVSYPREYFLNTARQLYRENGEPAKASNLGKKISVPIGKANNRW
jgi:hypothetical protein